MEKIKAAIAKVKSNNRSSNKGATGNKKTIPPTERPKRFEDIGAIEYVNTKVIDLDARHLERNRIVSHLSHDANAGVFDSLRTQILQKMEQNNWQTIAVVSPTPNSGKTLVSINLALSIAKLPQKTVLLADFDMRKPRVASYLGIDVKKSLNEYIEGNANIEDVLVNPNVQRLVVLPTMRRTEEPSKVLSSSRMTSLLEDLKERYHSRVIIYDLPPLLNVDDAMILLPKVDCILLVIGSGVSTPTEIQDALHFIPKDRLLGTVFNKSEEEAKRYYY